MQGVLVDKDVSCLNYVDLDPMDYCLAAKHVPLVLILGTWIECMSILLCLIAEGAHWSHLFVLILPAAVVFEGKDLVDVDESIPYAGKPMDHYTATKIKGEQLVMAANSSSLATCALRPSGIFGEGDTVMVPTLVRQAKAGKMKYIIGDGKNMWDMTYAGNVAQAHILVRA